MIKNFSEINFERDDLKHKTLNKIETFQKKLGAGVYTDSICNGGLVANFVFMAESLLLYVQEKEGPINIQDVPLTLTAIMTLGPLVLGFLVAKISYDNEKNINKETSFNLK